MSKYLHSERGAEEQSALICSALLWTADCVALHLIISNCRGALRRLQCDVK